MAKLANGNGAGADGGSDWSLLNFGVSCGMAHRPWRHLAGRRPKSRPRPPLRCIRVEHPVRVSRHRAVPRICSRGQGCQRRCTALCQGTAANKHIKAAYARKLIGRFTSMLINMCDSEFVIFIKNKGSTVVLRRGVDRCTREFQSIRRQPPFLCRF
jgi:hypothetical protein